MSALSAAVSWIIGLPISDMTTRISFGIPHRVGACACEVGKAREDSGVVEMTETSTSWTNCVANQTRAPGHSIVSVSYTDPKPNDGINDGVSALATSITCWGAYDLAPSDPQLIIKTKGDVAAGVGGSFPSIQITLRPLKTALNYEYAGNLNVSGQGEIGFESQNPADDTITINHWQAPDSIPSYWADENNPGAAQYQVWQDNQAAYSSYVNDTLLGGVMITLNETHYFKSADRPGTEPTPWQPLTGLELDPSFHPRLPSMDAYDFIRNESYDFRYRYPTDYLTKYGTLNMPTGYLVELPEVAIPGGQYTIPAIPQGSWTWQTVSQLDPSYQPPLNPLFEPDANDIYIGAGWIKEGVAPVVKGWYWDSSTPPTNGLQGLFTSTNFKMLKQVRKRYPFSFLAVQQRYEYYNIVDHKPGNYLIYDDPQSPGSGYYYRTPAFYNHAEQKTNTFEAIAWWRMEITASLCDWNSKTTVSIDPQTQQQTTTVAGATIKGYVRLSMKALQPSYAEQGLYSNAYTTEYFGQFWDRFAGVAPSFVFRCVAETYLDENFMTRYTIPEYDAGTIPFEVTLTKDNATGQPKAFLDFPITSEAELPGQASGAPGSVPENSIVYVKDFVVTEVILP